MPPRKSSRSTRASVEPASTEPLPAKRKRGATVDPDVEEKENVGKQPPRTRRAPSVRSSVAPPSNGRASSRLRRNLPDVVESGDEEEDSAPPVKKARPSLEPEETEEEDEEVEAKKPKQKGRKAPTTSKKGNPLSNGRVGRSTRQAVEDQMRKQDNSDEEVAPIQTNGKGSNDDDATDDSDSEPIPPATGRSRKSKPSVQARKPRAAPKKRVRVGSDDDEGEFRTQPSNVKPEIQEDVAMEEEPPEEEEKSLFDPPPMPGPSSIPQVVGGEPQGPKPRLVIHKLALVNFKSYAGRQEIGPFHKVFPNHDRGIL